MATIKATIKDEKRPDGTSPLRIRVTKDRTVVYFNTGLAIPPRQWNKAATFEKRNWVKSGFTDHEAYNQRLREHVEALLTLSLDMPHLSARELVDLYRARREGRDENTGELLTAYVSRELALIQPTVKFRTFERYQRYQKRLEAFCAGVPLSGVGLNLVKRLEASLLEKNERSTVNKELEFLKMMLKRAVQEGLIEYRDNPFNGYKLAAPKKTHKEKLTEDEIKALEDLPLKKGGNPWHARNAFLLQYLLAGARVADVLVLKWSGVGDSRVVYMPMKGERFGKRMSVLVTPRLRRLLDLYRTEGATYVLPLMEPYAHMEGKAESEKEFFKKLESKTTILNKKLRDLATQAGIAKRVSTHVSRHSFADKMRRGGDLYAASKLLGHSTLKQTETYFAELDEEAQDEALRKALE